MSSLQLVGRRFGQVSVVQKSSITKYGQSHWLCQCDCGKQTVVRGSALTGGNTRSCGTCNRSEQNVKHGYARKRKPNRTYQSWVGMRQRCSNQNNARWDHYGGRGISVCERWENSFENFLTDMGDKPVGKSLDRIDVNGNYEPSNCRWASDKEQMQNRRPFIVPRPRKGPKLTQQAVIAIRACHAAGVHGNAIATAFQISRAMVSLIINRKCWSHVV